MFLRQSRRLQNQAARRRQRLRQSGQYFSRLVRHPMKRNSRALVQVRRNQGQAQAFGAFGRIVNRFQKMVRTQPRHIQQQQTMGFIGNRKNAQLMMQKGRGFQGYNMRQRGRGRRGLRSTTLNTDSALWRSIGMRLLEKLKPNRDRIDLFNKDYRAQIVRRYILGGLSNIGTNLKQAHGTVQSQPEIPFPPQLGPMFAISIRPTRFENLRARLGPWEKHLIHWQGTNGEILDKNRMVRDGTAVGRLKRGEIGCYDAHYRLWKHIVENNIPHALILEDDADIHYGQETANRINKMFDDLQRQGLHYDVVYVGHNDRHRPKKMLSGIGVPGGTQGLFMYYLTLEGARKLIPGAIPMTQAVDDYVYVNRSIRQFTLEPRLGYVVNIERSDTANIV